MVYSTEKRIKLVKLYYVQCDCKTSTKILVDFNNMIVSIIIHTSIATSKTLQAWKTCKGQLIIVHNYKTSKILT